MLCYVRYMIFSSLRLEQRVGALSSSHQVVFPVQWLMSNSPTRTIEQTQLKL